MQKVLKELANTHYISTFSSYIVYESWYQESYTIGWWTQSHAILYLYQSKRRKSKKPVQLPSSTLVLNQII